MDRDGSFFRQVQLLLNALPHVAEETCFALKGGTAINLFHLPMPRLSVDIDLTYLPLEDRETSLSAAREAMTRVVSSMMSVSPHLEAAVVPGANDLVRARVFGDGVQVKIELNPVLRGAIEAPEVMEVHTMVQETFGFAEMQVLGLPDLFGGKICAALDRQHPRDLFDVHLLLDSNGLTREVFEGFLVHLISRSRPISELLSPTFNDISGPYKNQFLGMTREPISLETLLEARESLLSSIANRMTDSDKEFLLSIKRGVPQWSQLALDGVDQLPAVRWKLENIRRMRSDQHTVALIRLEQVLAQM